MMNKYVTFPTAFLCFNLLLGAAQANASKKFEISVVNDASSDIALTQATWSLGRYTAADYMIPEYHTGEFGVSVPGGIKGSLSFAYATATTVCKFRVDWGTKPGRGWLVSLSEPFETVRGQSVGQFGAVCNAAITRNELDDGFDLKVSIK